MQQDSDENDSERNSGDIQQKIQLDGSEAKKKKKKQQADELKLFEDRLKLIPNVRIDQKEFPEEWINKWRNLLLKKQNKK